MADGYRLKEVTSIGKLEDIRYSAEKRADDNRRNVNFEDYVSLSSQINEELERRKNTLIEDALSEELSDYEEVDNGVYKILTQGSTAIVSNNSSNIEYAVYDEALPELEAISASESLVFNSSTSVDNQAEVQSQVKKILQKTVEHF